MTSGSKDKGIRKSERKKKRLWKRLCSFLDVKKTFLVVSEN